MHIVKEEPTPINEHRASLLVIDDDDDLRSQMVLMLCRHGYDVEEFADARLALEHLRAGGTPDLILLDLMMPGMSGWEFRVQQKRDARYASIPVVALSADQSPQAAAIDSQAYLTKPIDQKVLLESIDGLLRALQRRRIEAHTRELERLSSLGVLAAGIAHEVNNPMMFTLGNLELADQQCCQLQARLSGPEAVSLVGIRQLLATATRGAERIAEVVRGMSLFATADHDELATIDLVHIVEATLQLVAHEVRHVCRVERDFGTLTISTNPGKLGQVFLNIVVNAVHAMREAGGRDHVLKVSAHCEAQKQIRISFSDTGAGIPPNILKRIFDPFFSTKDAKVGMGLGLAISRELVQSLGGTLEAESSATGSTFHVVLPVGKAVATATATRKTPAAAAVPLLAHTRARVLVIDDEPQICSVLKMALASDYDVVALSQSHVALALLMNDEHFDIILCDMFMSATTGMEVYERAVALHPALASRFVFMTGGCVTDAARDFLASTQSPRLLKPFRHTELVEMIEARLPTKH